MLAYVLRNSACEYTLDLCSPTGKPLADLTPSNGDLRVKDEKNSAPSANGEAEPAIGDTRGVGSVEDRRLSDLGGWDNINSYISRNRSKLVGKKMSK